LGELASHFDQELAQKCYASQKSSEEAIIAHMYDPETHLFRHRWQAKSGAWQLYDVKTVQILFPLLLSSLPQEGLAEILKLLRDPNEFGTNYMVPTVSKSALEYNPIANTLLLWRGPVWGFTNWFIMEGLDKHGQQY
jgi:Glycosyl hydrolase family 63 C-terminal domain